MNLEVDGSLPEPFCYYKAILREDHFHFGFWGDRSDSGEIMEEAQQAMFEHLLSFFPRPPASVLDVGCGLGLSAYLMSERGYEVVAIAPSPEMIEYARRKYGTAGVKFVDLGFFDEDETIFARERYDVILFQESAQYLNPLHAVVAKARLLLKDNGFLVIGDEVCYDKSIKSETAVHRADEFVVALAENGFRISEREDISKSIFPTYDFVIRGLTRYRDGIPESSGSEVIEKIAFYVQGWKKQKEWNEQQKMGYEIFVGRKDTYSVRPYLSGDEHKILPVFRKAFGVERTIEHWYWKFKDNPYGCYKISECFSEDGKLVAHYAGYPVPFYFVTDNSAETFLSLQIGDTLTVPEVRRVGRGKTSILSRTAQHFYSKYCESIPFTYGFNTGNIKKLGERFLGYRYIDPIPYRVKTVGTFQSSLLDKIFPRYRARIVNAFDEMFDRFFERVAPYYEFLVERKSRYLSWRYGDCPDKDYLTAAVYTRGGTLAGWAVFCRQDDRLVWGDALFDKDHSDAVGYVLKYVLGLPQCTGVKKVDGWFSKSPVWWNDALDQIGFEITTEPNNLFPGFYFLKSDDMLSKLKECFYYTVGDSDLF